ncbi:MAG: SH3 domain-containing protein [Lachnospiraceae bacterium]|nr:SH3 domain-containing protein [Lachnospiraceae bacterium]
MAERKFEASSIQIEDPMDFLSVSEKEAYMRAHRDTLMRDAEEMRRIREQTEPVRSAPRRRTRNAAHENLYEEEYGETYEDAYGEEDVEEKESVIDWIISVAMKAMLAAIIIVGLIMAYMMFLRPALSRSMGSGARQAAIANSEAGEDVAAQNGEPESGGAQAPEGSESVVTTTQLNLRTAPNTDTGEIITSVPEGTSLTRIAENDGWSTILYEGQELYCASEYLRAE